MTPTTSQSVTGTSNLCGDFTDGCTVTSPNSIRLIPGFYGNISISRSNVVHLTAGPYSINSLNLTGGAQIVIDSGPVVLKLAGQSLGAAPVMAMTGGAVISNSTQSAKDLEILYAGSADIRFTGGAGSYGVVYAPKADVFVNGGSDWFGSIVGRTVNAGDAGIQFHYDRSLGDDFYIQGEYRPISFNWRKF
jgi:hypothetical protein